MDAGEQAAFHGAPGDGVAPLRHALAQAEDADERAHRTWLLGVCLGASGAYGEAFDVLDGTAGAPFASLVASTLGSLHRQLTRYDVARGHDERARFLARTTDARVEAQLGLAADAVGMNRPQLAAHHLAAAQAEITEPTDAGDAAGWRVRTRAGWVEAEIALLSGHPEAARTPSLRSVELATDAHAPRHLAKSRLFLAVADLSHDRRRARRTLEEAFEDAVRLGCLPLVWPAGKLLLEAFGADLETGHSGEVTRITHDAVRAIRAGLPASIGTPWAASTGLPVPSDVL